MIKYYEQGDINMTTTTDDIKWYVGDPCYVIDDERWHIFCDRLFAVEHHLKETGGETDGPKNIRWSTKDRPNTWNPEHIFNVEVRHSPGGDGCWNFNERDDLGKKISLGVDAGLLAIVPVELCESATIGDDSGAWFIDRPTLRTEGHLYHGKMAVELNGCMDLSNVDCPECGYSYHPDEISWCDALMMDVCDSCYMEEE